MKREAALLRCREKDEIEKCRILQQDVKSEREEKRKMRSDVEHLKKQFYHESKRTEKEMTRLKEKIHQVSFFCFLWSFCMSTHKCNSKFFARLVPTSFFMYSTNIIMIQFDYGIISDTYYGLEAAFQRCS